MFHVMELRRLSLDLSLALGASLSEDIVIVCGVWLGVAFPLLSSSASFTFFSAASLLLVVVGFLAVTEPFMLFVGSAVSNLVFLPLAD